jgi:ribonuclease P protein component
LFRHSFNLTDRLKSTKEIKQLYEKGKTVFTENRKIKVIYLVLKKQKFPGTKISIAIAKRTGTAVWRNRIKRLIRESYRSNKQRIIESCKEKKILLEIVFSPINLTEQKYKKISLSDIRPEVIELLGKISKELN